jgi:prepilin-type N-terminal cleavage/methylation domain-containing protein
MRIRNRQKPLGAGTLEPSADTPLWIGPVASPGEAGTPTQAAFSLVEILCAVLVLGVALTGMIQGVTTALSSSKDSERQTVAALFAAGQIETLRAEGGLQDGATQGDCGEALPLYRWQQTLGPAGVDGLHEVTVVIENANSGKAIYELKTLLFEVPEELQGSVTNNRPYSGSQRRRSNRR